jgi:hypothetical protein
MLPGEVGSKEDAGSVAVMLDTASGPPRKPNDARHTSEEVPIPLRSRADPIANEPWAEIYKAVRAHEVMLNRRHPPLNTPLHRCSYSTAAPWWPS